MLIDLLLHSATQLITCASPSGPKRGPAMRDVGLIANGALAIHAGVIVDIGPTAEVRARHTASQTIDASGKVICPGLVDPHTHVVFAGDRLAEFEQRIQGQSYLEIMAAGGGIASTMRATRAATVEQLVAEVRPRLAAMLAHGTTTAEVKTGYGLNLESEMAMLKAIERLDQTQAVGLVPTFIGAHAVPPEFASQADRYIEIVNAEMLPAVLEWYRASSFAQRGVPFFADVFCERGAFTVEQSRQVLEAARRAGLPLKIHVDEFTELGGLEMALQLGATSVDHLDATSAEGWRALAQAAAVGVVIPTVNFNLGSAHFANARAMIDAGAALALATDINPGSAPCPSLPLTMAIACRYQKLLPAEALTACTINAAHAVGLGHAVGSLEVGKQADALIVNANDYRHLAYQFGGNLVETVIKRGRVTAHD